MLGGQLRVCVVVMATGEQPFALLGVGEYADGVIFRGGREGAEGSELRPGARVGKTEARAAGEYFRFIGFEVGRDRSPEEELGEDW